MWGADIGHTEWDELNLISKGKNYGRPTCEGACSTAGTANPKKVWKPEDGGVPAQVAIVGNAVYVTTLSGKRLWRLPIDASGLGVGSATSYYHGAYGRLRAPAKVPGADQLWMGSSGNGTSKDRIPKVSIG